MDKRGDIEWSLKSLAKMLMGALAFLVLAGVMFTIWNVFFAEKPTINMQDLASVKAELEESRTSGKCLPVPTQGADYELVLYPVDNTIKDCGRKPCLCLVEQQTTKGCEVLDPKKMKAANLKVTSSSSATVAKGAPVQVCNANNELSIKT